MEELSATPDLEQVAESAFLEQIAEMRQEIWALRGKLERTEGGLMAATVAASERRLEM